MKILKNIEGKNEVQLQATKDQGKKQFREIKHVNKSNTLKVIDKIKRKNADALKYYLTLRK